MKVYRGTSAVIDVLVDDKTQLKQTLQGENLIQANFVLDSFFDFKIGDYINWRNKCYTIFKQPSVDKSLANSFQYNFDLESDQYRLLDALYLFDGQADFYLVGDVEKFANLIIVNLNRLAGEGYYQLGEFPNTDVKNLNFQNTKCLTVLQQITKEFDLEYQFSDDGKTIDFKTKIGVDTGLSYEFKDGLRGIKRDKVNNKNIITRLYAFGGDRNISKDYGSKRLKIDVLEKNTNLFGKIEGVVNFDDIYPHREGTVSSVSSDTILKFTDTSLDFDVNDQLIEGTVAKVTFNSGYLAGYELEISEYVHSSKTFTVIVYADVNGLEFPNETLKIQPGDKYVLHDIIMPEIYVTNAESKLQQEAQKYLDENSLPNVIYSIQPDYIYLRKNLIQLNVGDLIEIKDDDFGITYTTRIISIVQSLANKYKYSIKVGDKSTVGYITQVRNNQLELGNNIRIERQDRTIQYNRVRRNLKNIDELKDAVFDPDGYFDTKKIKPLSIETGMLSVGSKGQQFILRNLLIEPNYEGNPNKVKCGNGTLVHFTIDDDEVKEWNLTGNIVVLDTPSSFYYVYAKCHQTSGNGLFEVSTTQYQTEGADYYYFLIGVVHSVVDGVRGVSLTYGQTTINGKFITTGKVQSIDGHNYFDLDGNKWRVGNDTAGMDWNVTNADKLTIKGGLVQSPAGVEFPIAVFRGEWNNTTEYFKGDQITYNGSSYMYMNNTSSVGNSPTNSTYFEAYALAGQDGEDGTDGTDGNSVFVQYSVDGVANWHNTFEATDIYMRQKIGSGVWSTAIRVVGEEGIPGVDGNFVDYVFRRYPVNFVEDGFVASGFINNIYSLPNDDNPSGWFDSPPNGTDPLWMSKATKDASGNLIGNWSAPIRISGNNGENGEDGADGQDGQDGNDGPGIVFRGVFNQNSIYYNNSIRRDVVKYQNTHYLYKGTNGVALAWSSANWETFGAQFESVATNLLLAEQANIADWKIKNGKITSQNEYNGKPRAQFDGANGKITLVSPMTTYTKSGGSRTYEHTLKIDSAQGRLEARHTGDSYQNSGAAYVDSEGIFANFAGTQALPASSGVEIKGAVVGLGNGKLSKTAYSSNNAIAGVVGRAYNSASNPAPAYGGYFLGLFATGMHLQVKTITSSTTLNYSDVIVHCYQTSAITVRLEPNPHKGKYVEITNINNIPCTVNGNGKLILRRGTGYTINIGYGYTLVFIWNGSHWVYTERN